MSDAWKPLPWQTNHWAQVTATATRGQLGHALLLAGPRGVGKSHFAQGLAAFLLCESVRDAERPCGQCRSCIQMAAGVHPNRFLLSPAEEKRDIAIDDVRNLIERLHLSSHYGQAKVAIVSPADALNASSVNALLKTVEEPPPATHLMFVAERWRALPATLRSRCQLLRFAPPAPEQALNWLRGRHPGQSAETLQAWFRSPLLVDRELDKDAAEIRGKWARALTGLLGAQEGRLQSLKLAQGLKRDEAQAGLEYWLQIGVGWLRQLLSPASKGHQALTAPPKGISAVAVQQLLDDAVAGLRGLDRNGNPAMILESIMIRLSRAVSHTG